MKKTTIFLAIISICAFKTIAQKPIGRISVPGKHWQANGIFSGKLPQDEMLIARTAYTKKFHRTDGQVDIIFGGPFHYTDAAGAWQDIDLKIKSRINNGYAYENEANQFISCFAAKQFCLSCK